MAQLTDHHVLTALRRLWPDILGVDAKEINYRPGDNFIHWLDEVGVLDEIDLMDLAYRWRREFGLAASDQEFADFLNGGIRDIHERTRRWEAEVKPTLTFDRLAQWIADHTPVPSFSPVNIAGIWCGPAGAFFGIAESVQAIRPGHGFPPSAGILSRIRGREIAVLWSRFNLYAEGRLPELRFPYARLGCGFCVTAIAGLVVIFSLGQLDLLIQYESIMYLAGGCVAMLASGFRMMTAGDPLPPQIKTFRDLAYAMSAILHPPEPQQVGAQPDSPMNGMR